MQVVLFDDEVDFVEMANNIITEPALILIGLHIALHLFIEVKHQVVVDHGVFESAEALCQLLGQIGLPRDLLSHLVLVLFVLLGLLNETVDLLLHLDFLARCGLILAPLVVEESVALLQFLTHFLADVDDVAAEVRLFVEFVKVRHTNPCKGGEHLVRRGRVFYFVMSAACALRHRGLGQGGGVRFGGHLERCILLVMAGFGASRYDIFSDIRDNNLVTH